MAPHWLRPRMVFFFILTLTILDRAFKLLALHSFSDRSFTLIPSLLSFTLFKNPHLAFSIPFPWPLLLIPLMSLILLVLIIVLARSYILNTHSFILNLSLLAIIFGGASNLWDHFRFGATIDYIHIPPLSFFNLADILIAGGTLVLLLRKGKE